VAFWGHIWRLGDLWGDVNSLTGVLSSAVNPDYMHPYKCMKQVTYFTPPVEDAPLGHEIVFGFLVTGLVCTPGIWLVLWKLRQISVKEDDEEEEGSEGSWHEDDTAAENLAAFKAAGGIEAVSKAHRKKAVVDGNELSPREPGNSAVAMAPPAIEASSENADDCGAVQADETVEDHQAEPEDAPDPDGVRDPRGGVHDQQ
jgi:hypothetical protein